MPLIQKWINKYNLDYEEILEIGRKEIGPPPADIKTQIREVIAEDKLVLAQPQPENIVDYKNPIKVKHHKVINEFPEPEEALEMNELAVEYVKKDPNAIRELIKYIKYQMSQVEDKEDKKNA